MTLTEINGKTVKQHLCYSTCYNNRKKKLKNRIKEKIFPEERLNDLKLISI